jgi:NADPH:quinone reductase-like Zn-dependent oxidoreductase
MGLRMKAAYTRYGPPDVVEVKDLEQPVPKDGEILIKIRARLMSSFETGNGPP